MIVDWFTTLFDATGFLTRDHCGPWTDSLIACLYRLERVDRPGLLAHRRLSVS